MTLPEFPTHTGLRAAGGGDGGRRVPVLAGAAAVRPAHRGRQPAAHGAGALPLQRRQGHCRAARPAQHVAPVRGGVAAPPWLVLRRSLSGSALRWAFAAAPLSLQPRAARRSSRARPVDAPASLAPPPLTGPAGAVPPPQAANCEEALLRPSRRRSQRLMPAFARRRSRNYEEALLRPSRRRSQRLMPAFARRRSLNYEEALLHSERAALTGLLEDLHRLADRQPTAGELRSYCRLSVFAAGWKVCCWPAGSPLQASGRHPSACLLLAGSPRQARADATATATRPPCHPGLPHGHCRCVAPVGAKSQRLTPVAPVRAPRSSLLRRHGVAALRAAVPALHVRLGRRRGALPGERVRRNRRATVRAPA